MGLLDSVGAAGRYKLRGSAPRRWRCSVRFGPAGAAVRAQRRADPEAVARGRVAVRVDAVGARGDQAATEPAVAPEPADDPADAPACPPAGGRAVVERIKARYRSEEVGVAATGPPGPPAPG
jgi:hypothetical protein